MTPDAPEFRTKATTPISPVPFHPPEPSNIPVLRNQIDPVFNMTSTHIEATASTMSPTVTLSVDQNTDNDEMGDNDVDTSFSDPYDEDEKMIDEAPKRTLGNADVDDDYARTFDSDGEDTTIRQDVSNASVDQKMQSPPAPVPALAADSHTLITPASDPTTVSLGGRVNPSPPITFSPTANTAGDASVTVDSAASSTALDAVQDQPQTSAYEVVSNGEIDIQQLLDNITANAEMNASSSSNNATPTSANPSIPNFPAGNSNLPAHASLPPRPQNAQKQPMHPAYPPQGDIRKYHAGPPNFPPPPGTSYRPLGPPPSIIAAGAPGTSTDPRNVLPPPPSASFHTASPTGPPPSMTYPAYPEQQRLPGKDTPTASIETPGASDDSEISWTPAVQKLYDEFLADERMYVSEGLWDRFPTGSRLFIGNLPSEQVTKRDLFQSFYKYGRLAQISIKQAYGFVQFHDVAACQSALRREQGQEIRGRKMHLEISKPQKNTRAAGAAAHAAPPPRRSRSPDYMRGGVDRAIRGGQAPSRGDGYDRYDARAGPSPRDAEFRGAPRGRDDYRPGRSPSPPRGGYRGREEYGTARGYDYYDGRERRRSRSRSPYGRRDNVRYRERSISPRARSIDEDAELQIPRRDARDVPDVQIILMDELDRGFIGWVEGELRARGLRIEVMLLSPRISLAAVIKRQIVEGVLAVAQLTRRSQDTSKIPLQVFDRTGGANNIRFDEYQDLEPKIAAELVVRAKQTQTAAIAPLYAQPPVAPQQSYQPTPTAAVAPNLANLVGSLDNATLQKLLGTLNAPVPAQQPVAPTANPPLDLAGILGGLVQQQQHQQQQQQQQPPPHQGYPPQGQASNTYASHSSNGNLASMLGNAPAHAEPQGQSAQQVQNIMAQLAKFRQ